MRGKFLVFICPSCGRFTYIPAEYRIRICKHCSRIIIANPQNSKLVNGLRSAYAEVREYNKKGGKKKFLLEAGADSKPLNDSLEDLEDFEVDVLISRDQLLIHILEKHCTRQISLDGFYKMCVKAQLDWEWAGKRIEILASQGGVMFPNPWSVKYISTDVQTDKEEKSKAFKRKKSVSAKLRQLFGRLTELVPEDYVYLQMKKYGYRQDEVEAVLNDLVNNGYIIRPKTGYFRFIEDWIS